MADVLIQSTYELFFQKIASYGLHNPTDTELTDWFASLGTVSIAGKADKVAGATAGHFASLDVNGNLLDSGLTDTDFIKSGTFFDDRYYLKTEIDTFLAGKLSGIVSRGTAENIVLMRADGLLLLDSGVPMTNVALNSTLSDYYTKLEVDVFIANTIPLPNTGASDGEILVWNSGSSILETTGVDLSDLMLITALTDYYTKGETDTLLANKITKPTTIPADGEALAWDDTLQIVTRTGITISDLALITDLALKADKVIGATLNNFASLDATGNLLDSGYNASSFVLLSNMTDYSIAGGFASLQLASAGFYALSGNHTTGAGVTPVGTLTVVDNNGHTYYLLRSTAA